MAENNTSAEYNPDENSHFGNEDIEDSESIGPDSNLDSSDIHIYLVGSSDVYSNHTYFRDEQDDN